jgi:signal transduction histidine kinase
VIDRLRRAAAAHPRQTDVAIALLLFAASVVSGLLTGVDREASVAPGTTWPQVPLLALMTLPLIWRRDRPLTVLLTIVAGTVGTGLFGFSTGAAAFAIVLALASASYYRGRTTTVVGSIVGSVTIVALYLGVSAPEESTSSTSITFNVAVIVLSFVTGDVLRGHREALAELAERNRRLEQLRDVEKREAVTQDRMRIARELHDIVGHALAAVTLQARAGERLATRDAAAARAAFEQIEEVASRALGETREAVGVLRSGDERAELRPQPTLDDLPELVRAVTTPEVRVTLRRDAGAGAALPPAVQASAYRIVQESLANVVKHAGPAAVVVTVAEAGGGLRVEVRDDGRGADDAPRDGGSGIGGMRARADQLGGSLAAGPAEGGGWLVAAELPGARR